jgi:hypothetical protein
LYIVLTGYYTARREVSKIKALTAEVAEDAEERQEQENRFG